jgi:hypothetical protein
LGFAEFARLSTGGRPPACCVASAVIAPAVENLDTQKTDELVILGAVRSGRKEFSRIRRIDVGFVRVAGVLLGWPVDSTGLPALENIGAKWSCRRRRVEAAATTNSNFTFGRRII